MHVGLVEKAKCMDGAEILNNKTNSKCTHGIKTMREANVSGVVWTVCLLVLACSYFPDSDVTFSRQATK